MFQIIDIMNQNDAINDTKNLGVCNELIGAQKVKAGGTVTIGVPEDILMQVIAGTRIAVLLVLDKSEYDRIDNLSDDEAESIIVWKDGTYKKVTGATWEFENDKNWLSTIKL